MAENIKDVSQSTDIYEIAEVIQQLNPDAEIRVADMMFDPNAERRFYSSVPVEKLTLPEGFYYNEKNGVTNKHNTKTRAYCSLQVEDLSLADESTLKPKFEKPIEKTNPSGRIGKRLDKKYDELFKYLGDRFGYTKLSYKDYLGLRDDERKRRLEKFLERNLPCNESTPDKFKKLITELNENYYLKEEDKIIDKSSLSKLGQKLYPTVSKDIKKAKIREQKEKTTPKKASLFKRIIQNIPSGGLKASAVSLLAFVGTRMLGTYAGWHMATMMGTATVTLIIPATVLAYSGIRYVVKKAKDGSIKRWYENYKQNKMNKENELENNKVESREKNAPLPSERIKPSEEMTDTFAPIPTAKPNTDTEVVPQVPVLEKPTPVEDNPIVSDREETPTVVNGAETPIETDFVDKEDNVESNDTRYNFSPRRQLVIDDLTNSLNIHASNTDRMIEENKKAKKDLTNFKRNNTRNYNRIKNTKLVELEEEKKKLEKELEILDKVTSSKNSLNDANSEYKAALRETSIVRSKLEQLKAKREELLKLLEETKAHDSEIISQRQQEIDEKSAIITEMQDKYRERNDLLQTISTKKEVKRDDSNNRNREVITVNGERKIIYMPGSPDFNEPISSNETMRRR